MAQSLPPIFNQTRKENRAVQLEKRNKDRNKEFDRIDSNNLTFYRDILLFSGTIFGSSIALSIDRKINSFFIIAEFFLMVAIVCGLITLWAKILGDYSFHWMRSYFDAKFDYDLHKDIMEDFEKKASEDSMINLKRLMDKKGILYPLLKLIKIDYIQTSSIIFAILGIVFLWVSTFNNTNLFELVINLFRNIRI